MSKIYVKIEILKSILMNVTIDLAQVTYAKERVMQKRKINNANN